MTVLDALDRLVATGEGLVAPEVLAAAEALSDRARAAFDGDTLVVALVGGTGSGKSAILNALAGEEVVTSGAFRPTTTHPVALVGPHPEPGLESHLARLGVSGVVRSAAAGRFAFVDLPDVDSVRGGNRAIVEGVIPLVDIVVWVLDPEKYRDRVVHGGLIRPALHHADRFVFALNQLDRVPEGERAGLLADLAAVLVSDGIPNPRIVAVSADPPVGLPDGVDELRGALEDLGPARDVIAAKALADVAAAARGILAAAGPEPRAPRPTPRWRRWAAKLSGRRAAAVGGGPDRRRAELVAAALEVEVAVEAARRRRRLPT